MPVSFRIYLFLALTFLFSISYKTSHFHTESISFHSGFGSAQGHKEKPIPVAVAFPRVGEAVSYYTTTSTLQAEYKATILARSSGVILELFHEEGDIMQRNQLLLQLEDDDQQLKVKQAKLKLAQINSDYLRRKKMQKAGILSAEEFEQTENDFQKIQAELEIAELELSYTKIKAPFQGKVVQRFVDLGENVQAGTPLFAMMDVDPLLARVHVPANRINQIEVGQLIKIHLDSNQSDLNAEVKLISPIVDPDSGTVKITAEIKKYVEGTRPGDFAEVKIATQRHSDAILIPSQAVFEDQGEQIVYLAKDGVAVRTPVTLGIIDQDETEIRSGISPDDRVIIKGQRNLKDGVPVNIPNDQKASK